MNNEAYSNVHADNTISVALQTKSLIYQVFKRVFDILCAIVGIIALVPLSIIIKISYLLTGDKESIFFVQKRIGYKGKEFNFYKFRTMIPNADEELERLLKENKDLREEYRINKKLSNDPRITKMGNFLRRTSLDEMPQFINVLLGDMAVVGNRPYLPREKEDMGEAFDEIVSTKGGIISYWAVMGRSNVSFKERLKLESYYSQQQSIKLDLKIFFRAIDVVILRRGSK